MIDISKLKNSRVAVIDGDSLAWIIGWGHKEHDDVDQVIDNVDDFMHSILQATECRFHVGILNPKNTEKQLVANFRTKIAITKPYKGNRGEKPEWYIKWAKYIEHHLQENWGFQRVQHDMEADDVVCSVMIYLNSIDTCAAICCGNDKDLLQIPGHHYNFFKNVGKEVTVKEAVYSLYNQVLCGDSADNIPGLYKCGPKGAELILGNPELDENNIHVGILHAFTSKLGVDKGIQSFYENYMLCKLRTDLSLEDRLLSSYDLDAGAVREFKPREDEVEELPSFNSDLFTVE